MIGDRKDAGPLIDCNAGFDLMKTNMRQSWKVSIHIEKHANVFNPAAKHIIFLVMSPGIKSVKNMLS